MKPKVYLETTVVSYLTSWRSPELVTAANQEATRQWWDVRKENFDLFVSEAVIEEASAGNEDAASRRLKAIQGVPELDITDEARELAKTLAAEVPLPQNAQLDALHIAVATFHGIDYLLTWNCKHLANAALRHRIEAVCRSAGFEPTIICTPLELMER